MNRRSKLKPGRIKSLPAFKKIQGRRVKYAYNLKVSEEALMDANGIHGLLSCEADYMKSRFKIKSKFEVQIGQDADDFIKNLYTCQLTYFVIKSYRPWKKK